MPIQSAAPVTEQRRIAEVLDRAEALRARRRAALAQLDSLTQSIFLDLFGDPVSNPKGIKVVHLADLTNRITDGVHQKPDYAESGVPFISVKDITTGKLIFDGCKFISIEDHQRFTKRCKPERLDILYTKVGATYGRPAIVETDREFSIYVSVCLIKPRKEVVDPHFLAAALGTSAVKNQADRRIKGIGVPDLHLDQIQRFFDYTSFIESTKRIHPASHGSGETEDIAARVAGETGRPFHFALQHRAFSWRAIKRDADARSSGTSKMRMDAELRRPSDPNDVDLVCRNPGNDCGVSFRLGACCPRRGFRLH